MTEPVLAFDRDPLFGNLSNPLVKVETRLNRGRQRFWCWKEKDFFWFWNEEEPDFFGVFIEEELQRISLRQPGHWSRVIADTTDTGELRRAFHSQLHGRHWMRAVTLPDPRPGKSDLWRVLWRNGRKFLLQNASSGRAVQFFPEVSWPKASPHWRQLNSFEHDAAFFAQMFWPLLVERRGRLRTAFEFLELPVEVQKNPIRFKRDDYEVFVAVVRAALIVIGTNPSWPQQLPPRFVMQFHHRTSAPTYNLFGGEDYWNRTEFTVTPKLRHLVEEFQPYLVSGFALHSVASSPLVMPCQHNKPHLAVKTQGPFTAHERLEALLTVRDWLAQNAPELLSEWE